MDYVCPGCAKVFTSPSFTARDGSGKLTAEPFVVTVPEHACAWSGRQHTITPPTTRDPEVRALRAAKQREKEAKAKEERAAAEKARAKPKAKPKPVEASPEEGDHEAL